MRPSPTTSLRATACVITTCTSITVAISASPAYAESTIIDAPTSGVELGLGWNGLSEQMVPNRCIQFAPVQETGQQASLSLSEVSDSEELRKQLGVSVSASIHGILGSASASAEFAENSSVKTTSTNFAVRAAITNGVLFAGPTRSPAPRRFAFTATEIPQDTDKREKPGAAVDEVRIQDWVLEEIKQAIIKVPQPDKEKAGLAAFQKLCGTHYVSALYSGAEMFNVISITTAEEATKTDLKAAISASYGIGAGSASAQQSAEEKLAKSNARMSFFQRGGSGGILPSSREKTLQKLDVLAREAADSPEFFDMRITSYDDLPNWPFSQQPVADDSESIVVRRYYQLKTLYRDLQAVIADLRANTADPSKSLYDACFGLNYYTDMQDNVAQLLKLIENGQQAVESADWDYTHFNANMNDAAIASLGVIGQDWRNSQDVADSDKVEKTAANEATEISFIEWLEKYLSIAHLKAQLPPLKANNISLCGGESTDAQRAQYRQRVMALYVRPANARVCEQNINDIDCLSNYALDQVEHSITYKVKELALAEGATGVLCSTYKAAAKSCVADQTIHGHLRMTSDSNHWAAVTVMKSPVANQFTLQLQLQSGPVGIKIGGKHATSGNKPVLFLDPATTDDNTQISWAQSKRLDGGPGYRLLDPAKGNCLLDWRDGYLLTYNNQCKPAGDKKGSSRSDGYGWQLIDKSWFQTD